MKRIPFNDNWLFRRQGGVQGSVILPHDAMLEETRSPDAKGGSTCTFFPGGLYEYDFMWEHPYDVGQLDEMVEVVCSNKKTIRVAGNNFPQAVVKSRLLKLNSEHIRFVIDCLRENTTQVRNMKQYLLTVLYNAPATIENHYAAQVNHDLYGESTT